jgi:hypothetical protein
MTTTTDSRVLDHGLALDAREARLTDGADRLAGVRTSMLRHPRAQLAAAAALMSTGVTAVLLGWYGASQSTHVEEQVPYLISGGLLGVALSTIGALLLFTHWLTVSIREAREHEAARRRDHEELVRTLLAIGTTTTREEVDDGGARGPRPERPLRGAQRGS